MADQYDFETSFHRSSQLESSMRSSSHRQSSEREASDRDLGMNLADELMQAQQEEANSLDEAEGVDLGE